MYLGVHIGDGSDKDTSLRQLKSLAMSSIHDPRLPFPATRQARWVPPTTLWERRCEQQSGRFVSVDGWSELL